VEALTEADPREVGEYQLLGRLGSGGMGRVFLAVSPSGRMVAVKVIRPELAEDPKFIRRFRDEVDAARRVSGFYTAPVVAAGTDEELPWLATAFVPGPSLDEVVTMHGTLPIPALWRLAAGLAEALRAIHSAGLVHRDLKPANVLLAPDGPRVIDFGIARAVAGTRLTTTGSVVGTPSFMSPEQVEGQPAGPASDMFSFGSVLAFAASGIPPFSTGPGGSRTSAMYRIVHGEPDLAGVAEGIRELITACLAKDPARRPAPGQVDTYHANAAGQPEPPATTFWPSGVVLVIAAQQAALGEQLQAPQPATRFPPRTPASATAASAALIPRAPMPPGCTTTSWAARTTSPPTGSSQTG
jgi:serine/threonine protein kinase